MRYSIYRALLTHLCLIFRTTGTVDDGSILHSGEATFYGDGGIGNCGYDGPQPLYHGAMNEKDYDSAAVCGTWVHIIGPNGEVTAFIDDRCPECREGDIDLGPGTFEAVADRKLGRAPVTWRYVKGPSDGPIVYFWQPGSSRYHIALQVRNHYFAITGVAVRNGSSDWIALDRSFDNFFVLNGGINSGEDGPYSIRVTDIFGHTLTDTGLTILQGKEIVGTMNFDSPMGAHPRRKITAGANRRSVSEVCLPGMIPTSAGLYEVYLPSGRSAGKMLTRDGLELLFRAGRLSGVVIIRRLRGESGVRSK